MFSHTAVLAVLATVLIQQRVTSEPCQPIKVQKGLNYLNCSRQDLSHLPSSSLMDNAEVLDFRHNDFLELPKLSESPYCDRSKHCHVINDTENVCRYDISFSGNEIFTFQENALADLQCLRTLDLSYNDIRSSILHEHTFQNGAYRLENLIFRGNPLGTLPDNVITAPFLHHIRYIDLSHCELTELGENSVDDHLELMTLNLSNNKLTDIKRATFKNLRNLRILDLSHNQLESFGHQVFADLINLDSLLLSDNKITQFARHAFYQDSKLKTLDLSRNSLDILPYQALQELSEMSHLILNNNPMKTVNNPNSSIALPSVRTLEMELMLGLVEIGKGDLASFPSLVTLSIRRNRNLASIHPEFLATPSQQLREVYLDSNGLTTLSEDALPLKQLITLSLKDNPWICDYRLRWMITEDAIKPNTVICDGPVQFEGRDIKTLHPLRLQRPFTLAYIFAIILTAIPIPVVGVAAYHMWRYREHIRCCKKVRGRYVTVYTRDEDSENEDRVDIRVNINHRRLNLKAVSNGNADDTQPFITMESPPATENVDLGDKNE